MLFLSYRKSICFGKTEVILIKIKFIAEELYRSFWSSWYKDILLMIMFSISLVLAVVMCSYYMDLGGRGPDTIDAEDSSTWYSSGSEQTEEADRDYDNAFSTVRGCRNVMSYFARLNDTEEYSLMSIHQLPACIEEQAVKKMFGGNDFSVFLYEEQKSAFSFYFGDGTRCGYSFNCYGMNVRACDNLGLKSVEGEVFTEQNTTLEKADDAVPVLLGWQYKGKLHVGQEFELYGMDCVFRCRVAGILEKNSQMPEVGSISASSSTDMISMDNYIIFPFGVKIKEAPEKQTQEDVFKFAENDYYAMWDMGIKLAEGKKINQLSDELREISEEYKLPMVEIWGVSMGLTLLRAETVSSIRIMLILTIALLCFTLYALFVTFYDKIQSNRRVYGIYLINGCSLTMILLPCLLEIAIILLPAIFFSRYVFTDNNLGGVGIDTEFILRTAYTMVGIAFLIGAAFVLWLMRGVDTERLVRQKDT